MNSPFCMATIWWALAASVLSQPASPLPKVTVCGEFVLKDARLAGLSGLTWAGGNQFYAASDRLGGYVPVTLEIDPISGKITAGSLGEPVEVEANWRDCEGIAWNSATKTLWLSTEVGPTIVGCKLNGKQEPEVKVPEIFGTMRSNLGLESLTCSPAGDRYWTANEETLKVDGPLSGGGESAWVRLQEFSADWKPLRQFAWRAEPAKIRMQNVGNGVSDLCLLADGRLLVLERGFGFLTLQTRLFLADFKDATPVAAVPSLRPVSDRTIKPAQKFLLLSRATNTTNYEGIALGPLLRDGSRSLILVADSGSGHEHSFLALKFSEAQE
jgi:hypothetical protein